MNTNKNVRKLFAATLAFCLSAAGAFAEEVVYKQKTSSTVSVSSGIAPANSTASFATNSKNINILNKDNRMTLSLAKYEGKRIRHIVLSMKTDEYVGAGNITVTAGATELAKTTASDFNAWAEGHRSDYTDLDIVPTNPNSIVGAEDVVISIAATTSYIACQSFKIVYDDGAVSFRATDGVNYYATFSHNDAVAFPKQLADGRKLHAEVLAVEGNVITKRDLVTDFGCEEGDAIVVPANTGVLLRVEGASSAPVVEYSVCPNGVSDQAAAVVAAYNMLMPCLATGGCPSAEAESAYYKLAYDDYAAQQGLGFWYGAEGGTNGFDVKGNGAVLCVPKSANSNVRGFSLEAVGTVTGLDSCDGLRKNDSVYNLAGQRTDILQRGLNVKSGRKILHF